MHRPASSLSLPGDLPRPASAVAPSSEPPLTREVRAILRRHPGAALPLEELLRRLRAEGWEPEHPEDEVLRRIRRAFPTLVPARRRWVGLSPRPWVLTARGGVEGEVYPIEGSGPASRTRAGAGREAGEEHRRNRRGGRGSVGHPLLQRLRLTLARVGAAVLPLSTREMARWERYMVEESEVHRALHRRIRARRRWHQAEGEGEVRTRNPVRPPPAPAAAPTPAAPHQTLRDPSPR